MSCNGCRVLRKGCGENCALRPCLQWIDSPEAQGYATVFVAKFFGRAGLTEFIGAVPESERPALFQSLLYEACGRTVNPVHGAIGLLWSGNWHICQEAVDTILKGGTLRPLSASFMAIGSNVPGNLSTNLQLFTNSKDRNFGVQQLSSSPLASELSSAFQPVSLPSSQPKRTYDALYERHVQQDSFRTTECKQQRPDTCGDVPKRNMDYGSTAPKSNTARVPTVFCVSKPLLLHPGIFAGAPAKSNAATAASQVHGVAPKPRFDEYGRDSSCPHRTRRDDSSFFHEDVSSAHRENLELDLTLRSASLRSARSAETTKIRAESICIPSCSTISFNSEGSVTDLGSSEVPISSCSGNHLGSRLWRDHEHKLLDLLV